MQKHIFDKSNERFFNRATARRINMRFKEFRNTTNSFLEERFGGDSVFRMF